MNDDQLVSDTRSKWTARVVALEFNATWTLTKHSLFNSAEL